MANSARGPLLKFDCACGQRVSIPRDTDHASGACPSCKRTFSIDEIKARTPLPAASTPDLLFGTIAVEAGYLRPEHVRECVQVQQRYRQEGKDKPLGEILVEQGYLTTPKVRWVLHNQAFVETRARDRKFGALAVRNRFISRQDLNAALNDQKQAYRQEGRILRVGELLIERGLMDRQQVEAILASQDRLKAAASAQAEMDGKETQVLPRTVPAPASVEWEEDAPAGGDAEAAAEVQWDDAPMAETTPAADVVWEDSPPADPPASAPLARLPGNTGAPDPPPRPAAPARPQRLAPEVPVDDERIEGLEQVEGWLQKAAALRESEQRDSLLAESNARLVPLTKWAKANAEGSRFLARIYVAWGRYQSLHDQSRLAHDAYLAAWELGWDFSTDEMFAVGKYLVADRRVSPPAMDLYVELARELPFRRDQIGDDDWSRILSFLTAQSSAVEGDLPEMRCVLARQLAESFPHSARARLADAAWRASQGQRAEAHEGLRVAWESPECQAPEARKLKAEVAFALARVSRDLGKTDEALEFFERSTDLDPLQVLPYLEGADLVLADSDDPMRADSVNRIRLRGRLSKAMRWVTRAEANARGDSEAASRASVGPSVARLKGAIQRVMDTI